MTELKKEMVVRSVEHVIDNCEFFVDNAREKLLERIEEADLDFEEEEKIRPLIDFYNKLGEIINSEKVDELRIALVRFKTGK